MASPQKENGYTPLANEIIEALMRAGLSGNQHAIILLILRESFGWRRKSTGPMGLRSMAQRTGIARSSIQLSLRTLRVAGIISQEKSGGWVFRKDYEKWVGGASPLAHKGPAHWPRGASPLAKRGQPTGPIPTILSLCGNDKSTPKESKERTKEKKENDRPGQGPDDFNTQIRNVTARLCATAAERAGDFSDYRLPANFGRYGGAYIVNVPADECEFLLAKMKPGPKVRAALEWRVRLKAEESNNKRRICGEL